MSTVVRGQRAKAGVLDEISIDWYDLQGIPERIETSNNTVVVAGCPLCDKIWSSKEAYQEFVGDSFYENIVIIMQNDEPHLYIPGLSVLYMQINFCPKCGRRLVEE